MFIYLKCRRFTFYKRESSEQVINLLSKIIMKTLLQYHDSEITE